ncbi:MAG TPA: hypothetical protein VFX96_17190 [Pyrinomonadaceae bacterium]|nr:hypothetical protein [Pyrinomonadaceae bacterium]
MSNEYPAVSTHPREIEAMLAVLSSVIDGRDAAYLSAPITSGKRLAEWKGSAGGSASEEEYLRGLSCHVVEPNRAHARDIARRLRGTLEGALIDPTVMPDIDGWGQNDYRHLWAEVIERYASRVVCIDGWNFSNGCAYEFLVAKRRGLPTLDERLTPITVEKGAALVGEAVAAFGPCGLPTDFLNRVYEELSALAAEGGEYVRGG